MSRKLPTRKTAPVEIFEKEGVSSEDEVEASAPENEDELLNASEGDDETEGTEAEEEAEVAPPKGKKGPAAKAPPKGKAAAAKPPAKAPAKGKAVAASKPAAGAKGKATKPAGKGKKDEEGEDSEEDTSGGRVFKINMESIDPPITSDKLSEDGGKFKGKAPMQIAKRVFTRLTRAAEDKECGYDFSIIEITPGKAEKEFPYRGDNIRLDQPKVITKGDKEITIAFDAKVKARKVATPAVEAKSKTPAAKKPAAKPTSKQNRAKNARKEEVPNDIEEEELEDAVEEVGDEKVEAAEEPAPAKKGAKVPTKTLAAKKTPVKAPVAKNSAKKPAAGAKKAPAAKAPAKKPAGKK